jgi:hypothetical protein
VLQCAVLGACHRPGWCTRLGRCAPVGRQAGRGGAGWYVGLGFGFVLNCGKVCWDLCSGLLVSPLGGFVPARVVMTGGALDVCSALAAGGVQPQRAAAFRCCQHTARCSCVQAYCSSIFQLHAASNAVGLHRNPQLGCVVGAGALHIRLQLCTRLLWVTLSQQRCQHILLHCSSSMCMCGEQPGGCTMCTLWSSCVCVCSALGCLVRSCTQLHDGWAALPPMGFCHVAQCPQCSVHSFGMMRCHSANSGVNGRLCRFCSSTMHSGSR